MRNVALALLVLASCSSGTRKPTETTESSGRTVMPKMLEPGATDELGTERTRGLAKTIDWPNAGTNETTTFLNGDLVVDRILREDAENLYGVRVRLGNRTTRVEKIEYRFRFFDSTGAELLPIHTDWRPAILEPRGLREVSDSCSVRWAVGFHLLVRRPGGR